MTVDFRLLLLASVRPLAGGVVRGISAMLDSGANWSWSLHALGAVAHACWTAISGLIRALALAHAVAGYGLTRGEAAEERAAELRKQRWRYWTRTRMLVASALLRRVGMRGSFGALPAAAVRDVLCRGAPHRH